MEFLDNDYLLDYKGKTFTDKLKDSIINHMLEVKKQRLSYTSRLTETALVVSHPTEKMPEIHALGCSTLMKQDDNLVEDLVLDNMMRWWSGWFGPTLENSDRVMLDLNGVPKSVRVRTFANTQAFNSLIGGPPLGTGVQVGKSAFVPTRVDVNIDDPFPDAPQSDINPTENGGWNSPLGRVTVGKSIATAGNNGDVSEVGLFAFFIFSPSTPITSMLTHDSINPSVEFLLGETLNITCTFTF